MEAIVPYLNFNGNAAEALAFYFKSIRWKNSFFSKVLENLLCLQHQKMKDKVMHATFQADKTDDNGEWLPAWTCSDQWKQYQPVLKFYWCAINWENICGIIWRWKNKLWNCRILFGVQDLACLQINLAWNWMFNHDKETKG